MTTLLFQMPITAIREAKKYSNHGYLKKEFSTKGTITQIIHPI